VFWIASFFLAQACRHGSDSQKSEVSDSAPEPAVRGDGATILACTDESGETNRIILSPGIRSLAEMKCIIAGLQDGVALEHINYEDVVLASGASPVSEYYQAYLIEYSEYCDYLSEQLDAVIGTEETLLRREYRETAWISSSYRYYDRDLGCRMSEFYVVCKKSACYETSRPW